MRLTSYGVFVALAFVIVAGCTVEHQSDKLNYFGQNPPDLIPQRFAPDLICLDSTNERDFCLSPDFQELYFTRNAKIHVSRLNDSIWSEPQPVSFSSEAFDFEAFVTPDNQNLYFISNRLVEGDSIRSYQMWGMARTDTGWGTPEMLTDAGDYYPTTTTSGIIYFTSTDNDLFRARLIDGKVDYREKLGDSINTDQDEYNAFVAPDESYIILTTAGWGNGYGGGDLYISFRTGENSWSRPRNMGPGINGSTMEYCPNVTPDGKYLFFCSRRDGSEDIYWVDASIIEILRTEDLDFVESLVGSYKTGGIDGLSEAHQNLAERYSHLAEFDGSIIGAVYLSLLMDQNTAGAAEVLDYWLEKYPAVKSLINAYELAILKDDPDLLKRAENDLWQEKRDSLTDAAGLEAAINLLGYRFITAQLPQLAMRSTKLNTELFPDAFNPWDSYGEVLLLLGDTTAAIDSYKKSLELEAGNQNAVRILTELGAI
jgi:tetratricopeptide (TPR) repeat protein